MLRTLLLALVAPVVAGTAFMPGAFAQKQPMPASQEDLFTYNRMGAVNVCYLISTGVPLKKAFPSSLVMIGDVIVGKHRSEILEDKKSVKLEPKQIEVGSVIGIMANIKGMCADKLKGDDKKEFDAQFDQIQQAIKQQTKG